METAIIMPIMVFAVLGALQLMLIQHARIMTEYAAYNAARAGIVHNANWNLMRNAGLISVLPLYDRTDTFGNFMWTWARFKAAAEVTEAIDTTVGTLERIPSDIFGVDLSSLTQQVSLVEVNVTSPDGDAFDRARQWQRDRESEAVRSNLDPEGPLQFPEANTEIDFDDLEMMSDSPQTGRLAVEVRVLYPLGIPVINKIFFEMFLAQELLNSQRLRSDLSDWAQWRARLDDGRYLDEAAWDAEGTGPLDDFFTTSQWVKEIRTLRWVAEQTEDSDSMGALYLIPIHATYAMQMQSNMYEQNRREPVWFTLEDL